LIRSVPNVLAGLKIVDEEGNVDYNSIMMGLIMELAGAKVGKYVGIAVDYINKIDQYPSLTLMIKEELLDKYVTLAFCKNIGNYGAYILRSMLLDDSPDGVKWDKDKLAAGNPFPFTVIATEDATAFKRGFFNVTPASLDGSNYLVDGVQHTYYRAADGSDTLTVVPSRDNGMIPSMITMTNVVDEEGKLDPTKRLVRWWTHFDVDVTDVNEEGISNAVHETFIQYGFEADALSSQIAVEGLNVSLEYPTIDLGITYINMTYAYREYNRYDFMFDNLLPNTTYYYRVGSNLTGWSQVYSFTTLPEEGGVEILAISDIQGSVERNYQLSLFNMLKAFEQGNPQMVISMGDNVDKGENINQWGWLLNDHDAVYAQYAFETVPGNHEDDQECIAQVVKVGDQAYMSATGYYYSYNYQNLHMVYLNTNDLADDNTLGHEQLDWLEHDLAQASTDPSIEFIVVCLHKGPFTAGSHAFDTDVINLRAQLTPIFINYGVDLVLQGHDHTYSVSQYITGMEEIWDEDEEHVIGHKYSATAPQYDATGAAKDPEGVLFVNLGTMGDKFYNYIYSDEVLLKDRSKDYVNQLILADYFVDDKLELKPEYSDKGGVATRAEAPVYAYLKVQDGRLSLTTYTVINGISHVVDDIAITKSAASLDEELSFKVLGQTFTPDTLKDVEVVRFAVGRADGFTYYAGYRLADISDYEEYYANNKRYKVKDTYVALYSSKSAGEAGTKLDEPICMVYTPDGVRVVDIEAAQNLSWWAILLIVVGALIVAGAIVCMVLFVPGKNRKPIVDINAIRAKPQKFDNQELSKEESKEEEDIAELKEDGPKEDDAQ
ncbi:MAG: metallophosphoesterase family protein, partial [Clostridia bacterium]|nr:metallophosphoesterase family protein [Clostridia bacterium]